MRTRTAVTVALLSSLVVAACGGGSKKAAPTTTTSSSTTTTVPVSTTLGAAAGTAPLTGLPLADAAKAARPVLVVKIDNAPKARPQVGLNQADVVVEEKVEDGVTRLFVLFHSNDSDPVGPVRSARTTDITMVTPLHHPLFAYSGTNATFQKLVNRAPLVDVGVSAAPKDYTRHGDRPAPYNLFTNTSALFARKTAASTAPPPLFAYRAAGQPLAAPSAVASAGVHLEYRGQHITTVVDYTWDAGSGTWKRVEDGTPHVDGAKVQVAPRNVVVQFVNYHNTGQVDRSGTAVPEAELIGSGDAWIFTDGKVVKGRWSKPSPEAVTAYTGPDGAPVALTPGQTWVELPPPGSGTTK
jgi:hypothetical protein